MAGIDYAKTITDILERNDSDTEKAISLVSLCIDALNEGAEAEREINRQALAAVRAEQDEELVAAAREAVKELRAAARRLMGAVGLRCSRAANALAAFVPPK